MGFDTSGDIIKSTEILGKEYKVVNNDDFYYLDNKEVTIGEETINREVYKTYGTSHYSELYNNADLTLKIVSIIRPKPTTTSSIYGNVLLYHPGLYDYLLDANTGINTKSEVVQAQKANKEWNVVTGENFDSTFRSGYELTPTYLYESSLVDVGGMERVTSYFYYTESFEQRIKIIEYAENYKNTKTYKESDSESSIIIKTKDYLESVTETFTSLVRTFSIILLTFSLVSILVAAILTAILTYISVVERKREIGLLRSLGARQRDISLMFITEASLIGVVAGILGIGLCYAFTPLVSQVVVNLINMYNAKILTPNVSDLSKVQWWLIPALFIAAIAVGILSSLVPAIVAGHKKPADALKE